MKILVTGCNGLLGQKLVKLFSEKEHEFIATTKSSLAVDLPKGQYHPLDITQLAEVEKVLTYYKPDVVINTAAITQVDECEVDQEKCWLNNVTAIEHLVKTCSFTQSKLIQLSTDFIFDGTRGPLDETEQPNPCNYYGKSKWAAEQVIQKSTIDWAILRTVLVYGVTPDMSRSNIVLWVKKNLEEGNPIRVVNDQWRTPTLAEDLAMGCYLAAVKKARGIYNISGNEMMTPYDMAQITADVFTLDKSLISQANSTTFTQRAVRPPKTGFITTKAQHELGYAPHTFVQGLELIKSQIQTR